MSSGCTIAYLTAGAGGMYCGSCMHDNTLARAWIEMGVDTQLIPVYTPIRTDEDNVSIDRIFFGGINVYLEQTIPGYRFVPSFLRKVLDQPWLVRWATSRPSAIRATSLGALTVSMLRGVDGRQRVEVDKLCQWLGNLRPRMILFTNVLIAGCAPRLKAELGVPLVVTLQGDDAFLEFLPEPFRSQAIEQIRRLHSHVDGFLVHSRYYANFMEDYLGIPGEKIHLVPLGLDTRGFPLPSEESSVAATAKSKACSIGYLARLSPEKGLHLLVDAFLELRTRRQIEDVGLRVAGWTGPDHQEYVANQFARLDTAGLAGAYEYLGVVDRDQKMEFLQSIDVLSVPTTYRDPKGLFVLESLAAGVPVVQPQHGAFPELLDRFGGGSLVPPNDPQRLADALQDLLGDAAKRRALGQEGARRVHAQGNAKVMAEQTWHVLERGWLT